MTRNQNDERRLKKMQRIKKVKRVRMCLRILALLVICQIPLFGMTAASAYSQEAEISLELEDSSIIQGEELPEFRASAEAKGDLAIVLDERSEYTVEDLLRELETGTGYTLCATRIP